MTPAEPGTSSRLQRRIPPETGTLQLAVKKDKEREKVFDTALFTRVKWHHIITHSVLLGPVKTKKNWGQSQT